MMGMLRATMRGLTVASILGAIVAAHASPQPAHASPQPAHASPQPAHAAHLRSCVGQQLTLSDYGSMEVDIEEGCAHDVVGDVYGLNGYRSTLKVDLYGCSFGSGYSGCSVVREGTGSYGNIATTNPSYILYSCQEIYAYGWMGSYSGGTSIINAC